MMLHFAQTAIAFIAAGASILIVAGLVREALHDKGRHLHLFPDAHDPPEIPAANPAKTVALDPIPYLHSRGENARHDKRGRSRMDNDGEARRQGRTKRQRNKKRDRADRQADAGSRTTAAETEDA